MKKIVFFIGLVIILSALYFFAGVFENRKSDKFIGSVRSVGENSVVIFGAFEDEIKVGKPQYEYKVLVDDGTKITKNSFVLPKSGEMFMVEDLPKETKEVGFDVLKKDSQNIAIGIEVTLRKNALGLVNKDADKIIYIGPKY